MSEYKCDVECVHKDVVDEVNKKRNDLEQVTNTAQFFKLLGDTTRLKIIDVLSHSELCVCDIAVLLNMTQSSISHQLKKLKLGNIVKSRKVGTTVYYSLKDEHIKDIYKISYNHICDCE